MTTHILKKQLYYIACRRQFVGNQEIDVITNSVIWVRERWQKRLLKKGKIILGKPVYKEVIESSSCSEIFVRFFLRRYTVYMKEGKDT